jgi:hypothetical protein
MYPAPSPGYIPINQLKTVDVILCGAKSVFDKICKERVLAVWGK